MSITDPDAKRLEWKGFLLALLVGGALYLFSTFHHDLWRPAEAREAGIAREMIESGNWVATFLNGRIFLEKPPLYTWCLAAALKIGGYRDWVVRIPVLLFTLGAMVLTFQMARLRLGLPGSMGALVALASTQLYMEVNHGAMVDNGLLFFTTAAMLCAWRALTADGPAAGWAALFHACTGLAFLTKGVIGPALILAPIGGYVLSLPRRWTAIRRLNPLLGLPILAVIIGAWLWALWLKGGAEYYRVFFIHNHLERFTGAFGPTAPWHYYLPYLPYILLPWTFLFPAGIWTIAREWKTLEPAEQRYWIYLAWWASAMLVMLSAAGTKDNQYLLPLLPPLVIVCAAWVEQSLAPPPLPRWVAGLMWGFSLAIIAFAAVVPLAPMFTGMKLHFGSLLWTLGLIVVGIGALRSLIRGAMAQYWRRLGILTLGIGVALGLFAEPAFNNLKTVKPGARLLLDRVPPHIPLWGYRLGENITGALIFYGVKFQAVDTLEAAAAAVNGRQPILLLDVCKREPCDSLDALHAAGWQTVREIRVGKFRYHLMGNRVILNHIRQEMVRQPPLISDQPGR